MSRPAVSVPESLRDKLRARLRPSSDPEDLESSEVPSARSTEPTWPRVEFSSARAYLYNLDEGQITDDGSGQHGLIVGDDGQLDSSVVNPEGSRLSGAQVERLSRAILTGPPEMVSAFCFTPRHAFVFYDDKGRPVAWLSVCFECNRLMASEAHPDSIDMPGLRALCVELGLPVFDDPAYYLPFKVLPRR